MTQASKLLLSFLLTGAASASTVRAQSPAQTTSPNLYLNSASQVIGPTILPEAAGAINGGNPFQGLGRPDDTGPARTTPLQQFSPDNNNTGLFTTGGSFPSTQSVEQPGFGGQAGFSSNNTSSAPGAAVNSALNQSSIPALNQSPGTTNPGPNGALLQNLNPLAQPGSIENSNTKIERSQSAQSEGAIAEIDKLLKKEPLSPTSSAHSARVSRRENARDTSQLAMALKEMHDGNYKKCLETVDTILKTEPKNAQAFYVKAVTNVLMRDFVHARQNYEMTLRCTTDEKLTQKARVGIAKLSR